MDASLALPKAAEKYEAQFRLHKLVADLFQPNHKRFGHFPHFSTGFKWLRQDCTIFLRKSHNVNCRKVEFLYIFSPFDGNFEFSSHLGPK